MRASLSARPRHALEALDVDADRERADLNDAIAKRHREVHVIDARLGDVLVDAVEEVHRVAVDLKLDEIVAEQTAEHVLVRSRREQAKDVRRRKGNVPELMDEQRRLHRAQILGGQREVIVLNPRHRATGAPLRFVGDGVREAKIHRSVSLPVLGAILEVLDEHVAERPQRAIGEAVVVAVHVGLVEPHAAERVAVLAGWNGTRPVSSATSRSAVPEPHATQVPCVRRIVGSSADTSPPAGCFTSIPCSPCMCSYGSRLETRMNLQSLRYCSKSSIGCLSPHKPCPLSTTVFGRELAKSAPENTFSATFTPGPCSHATIRNAWMYRAQLLSECPTSSHAPQRASTSAAAGPTCRHTPTRSVDSSAISRSRATPR